MIRRNLAKGKGEWFIFIF